MCRESSDRSTWHGHGWDVCFDARELVNRLQILIYLLQRRSDHDPDTVSGDERNFSLEELLERDRGSGSANAENSVFN